MNGALNFGTLLSPTRALCARHDEPNVAEPKFASDCHRERSTHSIG